MAKRCLGLVLLTLLLVTTPTYASFHLMQIETVIGGVCGDTTQQAIQLRMRATDQNFVGGARLRAHDAAGNNPVMIIDFGASVPNDGVGLRILITTSSFATANGVTPDFTMTNPIPASYYNAGRLTFEDDGGTIFWSLAWGGANYTGPNVGATSNDANGDFGPAFVGTMPFDSERFIFFENSASAMSTTNADDYSFSINPGGGSVTNNAGTTVALNCFTFADGFESGNTAAWSSSTP